MVERHLVCISWYFFCLSRISSCFCFRSCSARWCLRFARIKSRAFCSLSSFWKSDFYRLTAVGIQKAYVTNSRTWKNSKSRSCFSPWSLLIVSTPPLRFSDHFVRTTVVLLLRYSAPPSQFRLQSVHSERFCLHCSWQFSFWKHAHCHCSKFSLFFIPVRLRQALFVPHPWTTPFSCSTLCRHPLADCPPVRNKDIYQYQALSCSALGEWGLMAHQHHADSKRHPCPKLSRKPHQSSKTSHIQLRNFEDWIMNQTVALFTQRSIHQSFGFVEQRLSMLQSVFSHSKLQLSSLQIS